MQIVLFHLMPYADLDLEAGRRNGTVWVKLPNRHFDPEKGHRLYNRFLDELEYGEKLGFDVIAVNEHHQTAYGLMPSPIVTASALARRTSKVRIAILGSALPLRSHPLTIAEEHAMIDVISGGRLISGFVRGIGAEYHTFGVNPTFSHDRFHEAHDLIVRAWTEDTRDPDFAPLLAQVGLRLERRAALDSPHFALLGLKVQGASGECRITQVFDHGPAQQAGLAAGDVLVAVDDLRATPARLDALLARYQPGHAVQILAFRREELHRFDVRLAQLPPPRFVLEVDAGAGAEARRRRAAWCGARRS